ncbi:endonuclease (plasmid) [Cupriavidus sp. USMAA2-4]|nr:endonuclease [Cupriavidus sp. USMAA2-4]
MFNRLAYPMLRSAFAFALLLAATQVAHASPPDCSAHFAQRTAPRIADPAAAADSRLLCFRGYAVLDSVRTRTPLWSAEHLTAMAVQQARALPRDSEFYEEPSLPAAARANLADFRRSGYDRGHLTPSGDEADQASQAETFSLANVVPQNPTSNRQTWSHLETSTRRLVRQYGAAYVVTGPAFVGASQLLNGRVRIPSHIWKAIYIEGIGAAAYVAPNTPEPVYATISISEFARFTGVDPFPDLPAHWRDTAMSLPGPTPHPGEKVERHVPLGQLADAAPGQTTAEPPARVPAFALADVVRMVRSADTHRR